MSFTVGFRLFLFFDFLLALDFLRCLPFLGSFGHSTRQRVLILPQIGLLMNSVVVFPSEGGACFAVDGLERTLLSFPGISIQTLYEVGSCQSEVVESLDTLIALQLTEPSIPHISSLKRLQKIRVQDVAIVHDHVSLGATNVTDHVVSHFGEETL